MITVTDPDHKNVSVDVLRRVASGASVLPNEGRRKVYIFPDCSLLDLSNQLHRQRPQHLPHAYIIITLADKSPQAFRDGGGYFVFALPLQSIRSEPD